MKDILFVFSIIASLVFSLYISYANKTSEKNQPSIIRSPIYKQIEEFETKYNINLNHAKHLKYGNQFKPSEIQLIKNNEKDYDAIIIGDSSVYMGLSSKAINQLTNKKIGFFSFSALSMNKNLIEFTDLIIQNKLKKGGLILFMFNDSFWFKNYYLEQENNALEMLLNDRDAFNQLIECFFCKGPQKEYFEKFSSFLKSTIFLGQLKLPSLDFYQQFIEKRIAPSSHRRKTKFGKPHANETRFLIEPDFVLIYKTSPNKIIKKPALTTVESIQSSSLELIMQDLVKRKISFAFIVPLTTIDSVRINLTRIYQSYFSDQYLVDINSLMPKSWIIDAQKRTHMSNLGSFYQSLLLAEWLNRYFADGYTEQINKPFNDVLKR